MTPHEERSPGPWSRREVAVLREPSGHAAMPVESGLEWQNPASVLENSGLCTWGTGLAAAGLLLWVFWGLLSGLLAEGQEEVCAQWLRKVHLQVCPHEQLEDIIANWLRRNKEGKSVKRHGQ